MELGFVVIDPVRKLGSKKSKLKANLHISGINHPSINKKKY
jgi:hypothetical protein